MLHWKEEKIARFPRPYELTNIILVLIFNLLKRNVHEEGGELQLLAVFVAKRDASIASSETIYGKSCLPNHVLLAKHIYEDLN